MLEFFWIWFGIAATTIWKTSISVKHSTHAHTHTRHSNIQTLVPKPTKCWREREGGGGNEWHQGETEHAHVKNQNQNFPTEIMKNEMLLIDSSFWVKIIFFLSLLLVGMQTHTHTLGAGGRNVYKKSLMMENEWDLEKWTWMGWHRHQMADNHHALWSLSSMTTTMTTTQWKQQNE